jgi:hypothetical protein
MASAHAILFNPVPFHFHPVVFLPPAIKTPAVARPDLTHIPNLCSIRQVSDVFSDQSPAGAFSTPLEPPPRTITQLIIGICNRWAWSPNLTLRQVSPNHSFAARSPRDRPKIIIIHLLGLAPAGYLTAPDNGPEGRLRFCAGQVPNEPVSSLCH